MVNHSTETSTLSSDLKSLHDTLHLYSGLFMFRVQYRVCSVYFKQYYCCQINSLCTFQYAHFLNGWIKHYIFRWLICRSHSLDSASQLTISQSHTHTHTHTHPHTHTHTHTQLLNKTQLSFISIWSCHRDGHTHAWRVHVDSFSSDFHQEEYKACVCHTHTHTHTYVYM